MRALVIHHDHVTAPGPVGERLTERGYEVVTHQVVAADRFHSPDVTTQFPRPEPGDLLVVMGAPWSAYDHARIGSWVLPELDLLRQAHDDGVPTLGVCFGGQLLALAHGGAVARSPTPELGWTDVVSDDDALVPSGSWFQWHYDRWTVPADAVEVARNPSSSQAFVLGRHLAVQFHPEMSAATLDGWLGAGGDQEVAAVGLDPALLQERTREREAANRARAHRLVDGFLDRVASRP